MSEEVVSEVTFPIARGATMQSDTGTVQKVSVQLDLTDEQREQIRQALGKDAAAIELTAEPLEERVAPIIAVLISL
jgi:Spy/CpxP family protein refolding chaperone